MINANNVLTEKQFVLVSTHIKSILQRNAKSIEPK